MTSFADWTKAGGRVMFKQVDGCCQVARVQKVVIGQQHQELRLGERDQSVEVLDGADIAVQPHIVDPAIVVRPHDLARVVIGSVVAHDQPKVGEGLGENAVDRLSEQPGSVERGNADRHPWHAHRGSVEGAAPIGFHPGPAVEIRLGPHVQSTARRLRSKDVRRVRRRVAGELTLRARRLALIA